MRRSPGKQHGVVAIEFALIFLFGLLPLLLITFSGVLVFAAQQSLTLAAAEGARAALRYGDDTQRRLEACSAAAHSMQWLLDFAGQADACSSNVSVNFASCPSDTSVRCVSVATYYDYDRHPFLPGTSPLYSMTFGAKGLRSSAVVQLESEP
jgi:Flp pilus assembly protein TadG